MSRSFARFPLPACGRRCANYLTGDLFPKQPVEVGTWCLCGPRQQELVELGTILSLTRRRELGEEFPSPNSSFLGRQQPVVREKRRLSTWHWPDNVDSSVDPIHGAHFDAPKQCINDIMAFRLELIPSGGSCSDYAIDRSPLSEWSPSQTGGVKSCSDPLLANDECCVALKGVGDASRVFRQIGDATTSSVATSFSSSQHVGMGVSSASSAAVGNFNEDDLPDIVMGAPPSPLLFLRKKTERTLLAL